MRLGSRVQTLVIEVRRVVDEYAAGRGVVEPAAASSNVARLSRIVGDHLDRSAVRVRILWNLPYVWAVGEIGAAALRAGSIGARQ